MLLQEQDVLLHEHKTGSHSPFAVGSSLIQGYAVFEQLPDWSSIRGCKGQHRGPLRKKIGGWGVMETFVGGGGTQILPFIGGEHPDFTNFLRGFSEFAKC